MTPAEAVRHVSDRLRAVVDSPSTDAEQLVMHVLRASRSGLYLVDAPLPDEALALLESLVAKRMDGVPLQYLTGIQSFCGIELEVGPGVLVPRPETEQLVSRALELIEKTPSPVVFDVGTGSGAIAIAIASTRPDADVWASDISKAALQWARVNVEKEGVRNVKLVRGDRLAPFPDQLAGSADLIVANPPYLDHAEIESSAREVRDHEPFVALFGGATGVELTLEILRDAYDLLRPGGYLVLEVSEDRADEVRDVMLLSYGEVQVRTDLAGRPRFVEGRRSS